METRDDNSARPREIADNTLDTAALSTRLNALVSDKSPLPLLGSPFRTPALALRGLSRPQSIYPSDSISMIRSRTGGTDVDRGEGEEGFYDGAAYELDSQGVTNGPGVDLGAPSPVPTLPGWPGTVPENMYNHRERLTDDAVRDVLEIVQRRADEAELADAAARLDRAEKKLRDTQARLVAEQLLRGEAERASRSRGDEARCAKAELANAVRALRKARDEGRKTDEERRRATRAFDEARDRLNKYHEELRMRDARAEGKAEGRAEAWQEAEWWLGPAKSAPVRVWAVEPKAAVPLSQVPQRPTVAQEYQAQVQHPGIQQQWQVSQQPPQVPVHAQAQYGQNLDYYQPPTQYAPGVQPAQRPTVAQYAHAPQTTAQPSTRTAEPQYPSTRPSSERVPPPPALPAGISLPPDVPPPPSRLPTAPSRGSSAIIAPIPERAPRPGAAEAYLDQLVNDPRASKLLDAGLARAASKLLDTELARSATKLLDTDLGRSATKLLGTEVERSASRATQLLDTELACSASHSSRAPHRRAASASAAQFDEAWPAPGGTATPAPPTHARSASQPESTLQSHRLDHPSLHPHLHRDTASNLDSRYPLFVPSQPASSVPSRARDHSTSAPDPVQRRNSTFNPALVPLPASSVGSGVSRAKSARSATRERIAGAIRDNADLDPALHKIDETDEPAYDPRTQLPGAYPSRSYDPPKPPKARPHPNMPSPLRSEVGSRPRLSTVHEDEYVQRQSHRAADTDPAESSPRMASEAPTIMVQPPSTATRTPVGTRPPTRAPTRAPSQAPTRAPTRAPSRAPSRAPTQAPTRAPSVHSMSRGSAAGTVFHPSPSKPSPAQPTTETAGRSASYLAQTDPSLPHPPAIVHSPRSTYSPRSQPPHIIDYAISKPLPPSRAASAVTSVARAVTVESDTDADEPTRTTTPAAQRPVAGAAGARPASIGGAGGQQQQPVPYAAYRAASQAAHAHAKATLAAAASVPLPPSRAGTDVGSGHRRGIPLPASAGMPPRPRSHVDARSVPLPPSHAPSEYGM